MQTDQIVPPPSVDESIRGIVAELVNSSPRPQRALLALTGLSKDQLCRMLSGARSLPVPTALAILEAADYPARGALALALFRPDLAVEWTQSGMARFFETLIDALPDALTQELGDEVCRVNPRWGTPTAKFVAQRLARHVEDMIDRERTLSEFGDRSRSDR